VASYAGLAPSPWQSGGIDHEQGISKAGNARVRKTMGQLAWLWLRDQPDRMSSELVPTVRPLRTACCPSLFAWLVRR